MSAPKAPHGRPRPISPRQRWRRWVPLAAVAAVGLAAGGLAVVASSGGGDEPVSGSRNVTIPTRAGQVGVPASQAGCSKVQSPEIQPSKVVFEEGGHPPYSSTPPTSGWHRYFAIEAAIYLQPQELEGVVANLAEGDVVLWHSGLTEEERDELIGLFVLFKSDAIMAVPGDHPELDLGLDHKIVLTAWGKLQQCERLSGQAIQRFFEKYRGLGPGLPQG